MLNKNLSTGFPFLWKADGHLTCTQGLAWDLTWGHNTQDQMETEGSKLLKKYQRVF